MNKRRSDKEEEDRRTKQKERGKNMKKLCTLALCACLLICMTACGKKETTYANRYEKIMAEKKIIIATSPDFPPYEFIDPTKTGNDQYTGADIELAKYIANALGVELELSILDFPTVLTAVSEGKVDAAISGLGYKPERAEAMDFSDPYNLSDDNCHGLLVLSANLDLYHSLSDFSGLHVAAQSASLQEGFASAQIPDVQLDVIASLADGVLRVQNGKSDALATSCSTGEAYAANNPDVAMTEVTFTVEDTNDGTMVGVVKGESELVAKINEIIAEVTAQGLYQKWEAEYTEYAASLGIE